METAVQSSSSSSSVEVVPSDMAVSKMMQRGLQQLVLQTTTGLVVGGLAGIVLARGGGGSVASRKVLSGFGGGCGFGYAWTNTSIQLEQMLTPFCTSPTTATNEQDIATITTTTTNSDNSN
jgi:hypothetical protein